MKNTLTLCGNGCKVFFMVTRRYRAGKDEKRARLLRERASRIPSPPDGDSSLPPVEYLVEDGGNVFEELGFPHPERELVKALLTIQICRIIQERNLTQEQAAEILGITQQAVSAMKNNRLSNFSVDRLIEFIVALGQDVEIAIRPAREARGQVSVILAPLSQHGFLPKLRSLFVRRPAKNN
jgi:predicted XRE-type DNA-binding protein